MADVSFPKVSKASRYLDLLINLCSSERDAADLYLGSTFFLSDEMDGSSISRNSFLGRFLNFSTEGCLDKSLTNETLEDKEKQDDLLDLEAGRLCHLHENLARFITILARTDRHRVLSWLRAAFTLNVDKQDEVPPTTPFASNVFFIHLNILYARLARPLTTRPEDGSLTLKNFEPVDLQYYTDNHNTERFLKVKMTSSTSRL